MIMKYKDFGTMLTKDEMKGVKGGVAWNVNKDFNCLVNGNQRPGGCTCISSCAHTYCLNTYGTPNVVWTNVGCPYDTTGCAGTCAPPQQS